MNKSRISRAVVLSVRDRLLLSSCLLWMSLVMIIAVSFVAESPLFAAVSARVQGKRPQNKFASLVIAYTFGGSTIDRYHISPSGSLQPLLPPLVLGGKNGSVDNLLFGPHCRYAYALSSGVCIYQLRVSADGHLVPLMPPSVPVTDDISDFLITPDGRFCYACDYEHKAILEYKVNPNGTLTPLAPASIFMALKPLYLCVDPTGRFLYTSDRFDKSVSQFQISASGQLQSVGPNIAGNNETISFAFASDHKALYLCNRYPGSISQFSIGTDGRLRQIGPPMLLNGANDAGSRLVIASKLKAAYVTDLDGHLFQYRINVDDSLSPLAPPVDTAGSDRIVISPSERFLYASSYGTQKISQYDINPGGTLAALSPRDVDASPSPEPVVMDPSGRAVYVVNNSPTGSTTISQYHITPNGMLTPLSPAKVATSAAAILITFAVLAPPIVFSNAFKPAARIHYSAVALRHRK